MFLPAITDAQQVHVVGPRVVDAFTEKPLNNVLATILERDSTTVLLDSMNTRFLTKGDGTKEQYGFNGFVPYRNEYVIRFTCKGYPTTYVAKKMHNRKNMPKLIFEKTVYIYQEPSGGKEHTLGAATVTASRILMVMKGDTIEYNAAAFQLAEGSMLDNLIRALPGVRLGDNGRITVNGTFVNSLLVNGREFFKGDPRVALKNLPAYVVDKVKVYNDHSKYDKLKIERTEEQKRNDPLVMDVRLKREYSKGWISNYEIGAGTSLAGGNSSRGLGRVFAMRFTNHSSLGVYAGANNLSDGNSPSSKGEWKKMSPENGEKKTYTGGINFSLEPKDKEIKFNTTLTTQRQETTLHARSFQEHFYPTSTLFNLTASSNKQTATDINWNGSLHMSPKSVYIDIQPQLRYRHNKEVSELSDLQQQDSTALQGMCIDTLYMRNREKHAHQSELDFTTDIFGFYMPFRSLGECIDYHAYINYNTRKSTFSEFDQILYPHHTSTDQSQTRLGRTPSQRYSYYVMTRYERDLGKMRYSKKFKYKYSVEYKFSQQWNRGHQDLWREREYCSQSLTPSVASAQQLAIDEANTYHTTELESEHNLKAKVNLTYKKVTLGIESKMSFYNRRISDLRTEYDREYTDCDFTLSPAVTLEWKDLQVGTSLKKELPALAYLLDIRDSTDPLFVSRGNSDLRFTRNYQYWIYYYLTAKERSRQLRATLDFDRWHNRIAIAHFHDRKTGVHTAMPMNINGNWQTNARFYYRQFLGSTGKWNLETIASYRYAHSVDYSSDGGEAIPTSLAVNNHNLREELRADFRTGNLSISGKLALEWIRQESVQHTFRPMSYTDMNYGITVTTPIIWGIDLDADAMLYIRRGYRESEMNTTDLVCNMVLSKALDRKKRWITKAVGFDLLHQLSNIRRTINAQGRTETWYNTVPAYWTLSILFRFDVKPRGKDRR